MAVGENSNSRQTNTNGSVVQQRGTRRGQGQELEKAAAFLNFAIPTAKGAQARAFSVPLMSSNIVQNSIYDQLASAQAEGPEALKAKLISLMDKLIVDFVIPASEEDKQIIEL